jgi:hypothetical protein
MRRNKKNVVVKIRARRKTDTRNLRHAATAVPKVGVSEEVSVYNGLGVILAPT